MSDSAERSWWARLLLSDLPKPPTSPAKDPADYPGFKGLVSRWVWRVVFQRLTVPGRWVMFFTLVAISYSGASLQLQGHVLALYAGAVWVVAGVGVLLARPRVRVAVRCEGRVCVGEVLPVTVEVQSRGWSGVGGLYVVPHELSRSLDCEPEDGVRVDRVADDGAATVTFGLRCTRRGRHTLRGVRVESDFPFGLLRARRTFLSPHRILVYPRFTPLSRLEIPTGRRYQPGGVALASELGESFEYLGNREYREGDNPRDIDWRATARVGVVAGVGGAGGGGAVASATGGLVVREWVEEYMLRVAVVLDTHVPRPPEIHRREVPARTAAFERAVSLSAAVSDYMARQDYLVDLFAAGPNLYHLTAGRSLAYLDEILDILGCVEQSPRPPFAEVAPAIGDLAERLSTVIFVALDFDEPRREFVQGLLERGVAVKLIVVRPAGMACTLDPAVMGDRVAAVVVSGDTDGGGVL